MVEFFLVLVSKKLTTNKQINSLEYLACLYPQFFKALMGR